MPADVAIMMLDAMNDSDDQPQRKDQVYQSPDGKTETRSFSGIEGLTEALAAQKWSGVRVGR